MHKEQETMKVYDGLVNLATVYAAVTAAALLVGLRQEAWGHVSAAPDWLRTALKYLTGAICATNILGVPRQLVDEHWEHTTFGVRFIPSKTLTLTQRRVLAGLAELIGIALADSVHRKVRAAGFAILFLMYGRGALINASISTSKFLFTGIVSFVAGWLFLNHVQ